MSGLKTVPPSVLCFLVDRVANPLLPASLVAVASACRHLHKTLQKAQHELRDQHESAKALFQKGRCISSTVARVASNPHIAFTGLQSSDALTLGMLIRTGRIVTLVPLLHLTLF